jgi:hypothetical protein
MRPRGVSAKWVTHGSFSSGYKTRCERVMATREPTKIQLPEGLVLDDNRINVQLTTENRKNASVALPPITGAL